MRLASFSYEDSNCVGVEKKDGTIAIIDCFDSMLDLITSGAAAKEKIEVALASDNTVRATEVTWQPPVTRPGKICGVAMNNSASNERKISAPDHPAFFLKPSSCLVGHGGAIRIRTYYGSAHPEPELAVVIGRTTKDIDAVDAMSSIFGYTIFNDITGNGMRAEDMFHYWALYADPDDPGQLARREQHLPTRLATRAPTRSAAWARTS